MIDDTKVHPMTSTPQKILVIGGSGFLGSHVADQLSDLGHEVTI